MSTAGAVILSQSQKPEDILADPFLLPFFNVQVLWVKYYWMCLNLLQIIQNNLYTSNQCLDLYWQKTWIK